MQIKANESAVNLQETPHETGQQNKKTKPLKMGNIRKSYKKNLSCICMQPQAPA